jgi:hypothetical protein
MKRFVLYNKVLNEEVSTYFTTRERAEYSLQARIKEGAINDGRLEVREVEVPKHWRRKQKMSDKEAFLKTLIGEGSEVRATKMTIHVCNFCQRVFSDLAEAVKHENSCDKRPASSSVATKKA